MTLEDRFEDHPWRTGSGLLFKAVAAIVVLVLLLTLLGLGLGWFKGAVAVVSVENVKKQYQFGYEFDRKMRAEATTVCIGEKRGLEPSALAAYEQTYANIQASYDARMANAFEAKHVKPGDLPLTAPTIDQRPERRAC